NFAGPVELVFFIPVQEVVLRRSLFDGGLYRKTHGRHAHAVLSVLGVESGLVEIKRRTITQSIQRRGRRIIQPHYEKTQPTPPRRKTHKITMERDHGVRLKRFGTAASSPSLVMKINRDVESFICFHRRLHTLETHVECLRNVSEITVDVLSDGGTECREVCIPRQASKIDVRTQVQLCFVDCPIAIVKLLRQLQ